MNYYSEIGINREKFSIEYLEQVYKAYKAKLTEEYEVYSNNEEKIRKLKELEVRIDKAYAVLSNDDLRVKHNAELDSKKTDNENQKQFDEEFEKSQILRYRKNLIKQMRYFKSDRKSFEYFDKENGRRIFIEEIGNLTYKTAFGLEYPDFQRYKVTVRDVLNDSVHTYNIFTSFSNLQYQQDEAYKDFFGRVLLSDENLKIASRDNGGYVGEIQLQDEKFKVVHNEDNLSAAIEFNRRLLGEVNRSEIKERKKNKRDDIARE